MKRLILYSYIFITLITVTAIGYNHFLNRGVSKINFSRENIDTEVLGTERQSVFIGKDKPLYEKPVKLKVEPVGMDLNVVEVGVEPDGTLEAPKDWYVSGWYRDGAKAGEPGNLIFDGHYDTSSGGPAAFWQLKNVKKDDTVVVFDRLGRSYSYRVNEIVYVDINDPNRMKIFESNKEKSTITLITCSGVWLAGDLTYSKRLVVKGELIS